MSYGFYKIIHLFSIVLFFTFFAFAVERGQKLKKSVIVTGVALVLLLVSGFGLVARIGIAHGSGWPLWLYGKLAIWLVLGVGAHVAMKRFAAHLTKVYWVGMILLVVAAYLANYKIA